MADLLFQTCFNLVFVVRHTMIKLRLSAVVGDLIFGANWDNGPEYQVTFMVTHNTSQHSSLRAMAQTPCLKACWEIPTAYLGWLWLRGRASILSSEGRCFNSPCLPVEVSLDKILNSKLLLMCWSEPCMAATAISVSLKPSSKQSRCYLSRI